MQDVNRHDVLASYDTCNATLQLRDIAADGVSLARLSVAAIKVFRYSALLHLHVVETAGNEDELRVCNADAAHMAADTGTHSGHDTCHHNKRAPLTCLAFHSCSAAANYLPECAGKCAAIRLTQHS